MLRTVIIARVFYSGGPFARIRLIILINTLDPFRVPPAKLNVGRNSQLFNDEILYSGAKAPKSNFETPRLRESERRTSVTRKPLVLTHLLPDGPDHRFLDRNRDAVFIAWALEGRAAPGCHVGGRSLVLPRFAPTAPSHTYVYV